MGLEMSRSAPDTQLTGPEREESGPVMIELALRRMYKLKPPTE